jgi:hypothetical protein
MHLIDEVAGENHMEGNQPWCIHSQLVGCRQASRFSRLAKNASMESAQTTSVAPEIPICCQVKEAYGTVPRTNLDTAETGSSSHVFAEAASKRLWFDCGEQIEAV